MIRQGLRKCSHMYMYLGQETFNRYIYTCAIAVFSRGDRWFEGSPDLVLRAYLKDWKCGSSYIPVPRHGFPKAPGILLGCSFMCSKLCTFGPRRIPLSYMELLVSGLGTKPDFKSRISTDPGWLHTGLLFRNLV